MVNSVKGLTSIEDHLCWSCTLDLGAPHTTLSWSSQSLASLTFFCRILTFLSLTSSMSFMSLISPASVFFSSVRSCSCFVFLVRNCSFSSSRTRRASTCETVMLSRSQTEANRHSMTYRLTYSQKAHGICTVTRRSRRLTRQTSRTTDKWRYETQKDF